MNLQWHGWNDVRQLTQIDFVDASIMYNKVYVEITNICNMNCSFCHGHKRVPKRMSRDAFIRILDKLQGQTQYLYYHLMGEPLVHPELPDFLRLARERGYKSILTTNGTLINRRGTELIAAGLHKINLSLHSFENGTAEEHRRYVEDLVRFAIVAAEQDTIVVFRLWNKGFDKGRNKNTVNILKSCISGDWTENSRGIRIREKIYLEWGERFEWPDENGTIKGEKFFCYGLKDQFGILVDGTVVPCCLDSEGTINLGNIFTEEIDTILSSARARAMVDGFRYGCASEDLCTKCGYAQRFV